MSKLHLVDGTYELFRSYYGAPSATAPNGREVGATRGLLRSMLSMLRADDVTHVGIAFDHVIESFRNELFAGYKTGDGIDPDLWNQFSLAERAAEALGMTVWPMVEFEADDALATAAARWAGDANIDQILLCSPDKDLAQCVRDDHIVMMDRRRDLVINQTGVVEKWGVPPGSIPDYLALVGDTADGIPGISRWGAKSTATVLSHYGTIEHIPAEAADWNIQVRGAQGLASSLSASREAAALYKMLATLRTDVPLESALDDLRWRGARRELLEPLCHELGDAQLVERVPVWDE